MKKKIRLWLSIILLLVLIIIILSMLSCKHITYSKNLYKARANLLYTTTATLYYRTCYPQFPLPDWLFESPEMFLEFLKVFDYGLKDWNNLSIKDQLLLLAGDQKRVKELGLPYTKWPWPMRVNDPKFSPFFTDMTPYIKMIKSSDRKLDQRVC